MKMNPPTLPADYVHMVAYDELVTALELIRHATAPSHDDGAYHENAHDLADGVLRKVEARKAYMRGVQASDGETFPGKPPMPPQDHPLSQPEKPQ